MTEELTVLHLQDSLCREIRYILSKMRFPNPLGEQTEMQVFPQALPIECIEGRNQEEEEDQEDPYPYCIVRVMDGSCLDAESIVTTNVGIGLYYNETDNQGHARLLNVINRICHRFLVNPVLDRRYLQRGKIEWVLQEGDTHPYYYGGLSISWKVPGIEREDELA